MAATFQRSIWWSWFFVNVGNDNITSSLVLACDQAGGAGPGAGGQKGKKDRLIADYFIPGLSKGDQEI